MELRPLDGFSVGITADRRWEEQAQLLERRGASILHGPTISTLHLAVEDVLHQATKELIARPPDYLVASTGIGMRSWLEAARTWELGEELLEALSGARILARGHKVAGALQSLGLELWQKSPTERLTELVDMLLAEPLAGRRVAFQEHGMEYRPLAAAVEKAGAEFVEVPVYRWKVPDDDGPALRLVDACCSGRLDAVTFTSAPAVTNLFLMAEVAGKGDELRQALNSGVIACCVGPVCAAEARQVGIEAPVLPDLGRLGLMVRVLSDALQQRRRTYRFDGTELVVQGTTVMVGERTEQLTPREQAVFDLLSARPGVVVTRGAILAKVWGSEDTDPHLLDVTIARLRRRLGSFGAAVKSSPGRGYRLDAALAEVAVAGSSGPLAG